MKNRWKKLLATTLALSMTMGMLGVGAWAEEDGTGGGSGETSTTYCGKEEHTHDSKCWESEGRENVEDNSGYAVDPDTGLYHKLTCTKEVHTHTDGCYVDPNPAPEPTPAQPTAVATVGDDTYDTLQAAINVATDGQTVQLRKDVTENVVITNKNITLDLFAKTLTGAGNGSVITINGGNVTLIGGGTITGGDGGYYGQGGGLFVKGSANVVIDDCIITDNHVRQQGGGVFIDEGTVTLKNGRISNNTAGYSGGGVFVYNYVESKSALFIMDGGFISENTANGGGGVGAFGWKMDTTRTVAQLNEGTIEKNTAQNGGGVAMECGDAPSSASNYGATGMNTIEINGVFIHSNHANQGGGVWGGDSNLVINGTIINGNYADQGTQNYGGGVYVQGGSATISRTVITGNSANYGGGIYSGHKTKVTAVEMTSGSLYGNTASGHSADVYNYQNAVITLPDASAMKVGLNGEKITGWFWDGNPRWTGAADDCGPIMKKTGTQCLIAAYAFPKHVAGFSITALYTPLTYMGEERLEAAKEAIENFDSLGITRITSLDEDGWCQIDMPDNNEVTLLFEIHVRGKVGMQYNVTSEGSTYVGGDPLEGTIPNRNPDVAGMVSTTTYVTKHYTLEDIVVNQYGNWLGDSAIVTPGVERNEDGLIVNESTTYREDWVKVILPKLYTVTYTDGVADSEVFADQVKSVKEGAATPTFEGTPTREGYTFTGWSPAVAETVTGDVTYTAQWSANSTGGGGGGDTTTYYTLTINYVDENGSRVATRYRESHASGYEYSVTSPSVEGMTPDQAVVSGRLTGNTTVDVTYTEVSTPTPEPTVSPEPTPTAPVEDLDENDTPLAELPTVPQQPATEPPKEEIEDLEDGDVPMAQAPETGDSLGTWMMMSAGALLGLAWLGKKREEA